MKGESPEGMHFSTVKEESLAMHKNGVFVPSDLQFITFLPS